MYDTRRPPAHAAFSTVKAAHRALRCAVSMRMRGALPLLSLLASRAGPLYFGNTLWCSYAMGDYAAARNSFLEAVGVEADCVEAI